MFHAVQMRPTDAANTDHFPEGPQSDLRLARIILWQGLSIR
jgi:hypothetical protein